jgi:hypothetical protein
MPDPSVGKLITAINIKRVPGTTLGHHVEYTLEFKKKWIRKVVFFGDYTHGRRDGISIGGKLHHRNMPVRLASDPLLTKHDEVLVALP